MMHRIVIAAYRKFDLALEVLLDAIIGLFL